MAKRKKSEGSKPVYGTVKPHNPPGRDLAREADERYAETYKVNYSAEGPQEIAAERDRLKKKLRAARAAAEPIPTGESQSETTDLLPTGENK